jgi:hypothetical protein
MYGAGCCEFVVNVAKDIGKDSCAVNQEHPSVKVISEHSYSENKILNLLIFHL